MAASADKHLIVIFLNSHVLLQRLPWEPWGDCQKRSFAPRQLRRSSSSRILHSERGLSVFRNLKQNLESAHPFKSHVVWKPVGFTYQNMSLVSQYEREEKMKIIINHFDSNRGLTTKTGLVRSLRNYYQFNELASTPHLLS